MALNYPLDHLHHPHHFDMPPRHQDDDDDEYEDNMAYLPGSGPSLEIPADYPYEHPGAFAGAPPPGFVTAFWNPYEVKHRRRTSRAQLAVLEREFDTDPKPNADKRRSLAAQLNMTPRAIQVWFQNRRAKIKAIKNKIPGGRGMPKLKPGEKAAARATRSATASKSFAPDSDEDEDENPPADPWLEISPGVSPMSPSFPPGADSALVASPVSEDRTPPASATTSTKPQFTIDVPPLDGSGPNSAAHSGPSSPDFLVPPPAPHTDFLAPPSPAAMLRRGSAPAPLQGIHRARYSTFSPARANGELELGLPPVSPISPPDHDVAPLRRASVVGLGRRPSLPDSHLRLPAHPYYAHPYERPGPGGGPRMQRRSGLLSPVPDVGHEQEQSHAPYRYNETMPLPTMLPPAPSMQPGHSPRSRMYRALPPGMGAVPAAHDLPTQFPARPSATAYGSWGRQSNPNIQPQQAQSQQPPQFAMHVPARPLVVPVAGPLPAADFSFGAPEPGHGDAFTRVMGQEGMDVERSPVGTLSPNEEFGQSNGEFNRQTNGEFAPSNNAGEYNANSTGEYNANSGEYNANSNEYTATEFAPPMWDARTRFGSMASIASDVTGVSVSSTQATSVSGGLGTAGFGNNAECEGAFGSGFGDSRGFNDARGFGHGYTLSAGYPAGFQPDVRRASCPGEFLHQFSGMGVDGNGNGNGSGGNTNGGGNEGGARSTSLTHLRPSMLGRSLTLAADAQLPSPSSNQHPHQAQNSSQHLGQNSNQHSGQNQNQHSAQNQHSNPTQNQRGLTISSEGHRGLNLALEAKNLRSPTFPPGQVDPTYPPPPPGLSVGAGGGPFAPRDQGENGPQQHMGHSMGQVSPTGQHMNQAGQHMSSQHMNQANLSPAQRALIGGGFGSEPSYSMTLSGGYDSNSGFETHTPPSYDTSPNVGGVDGMGVVDGMGGMNAHGSSGKGSPMLFSGVGVEGDPMFGMNTMSPDSLAMAMIGQEYGMPGFSFP